MSNAIDIDAIRELTNFKSAGAYVVSFYLNVNGAKFPRKQELEVDLKALIRRAEKDWFSGAGLSHDRKQFLENDLEKISQFVRYDFSRGQTRGLAIFTSQERGFWQVYSLPVPVPSKVVVDREPYTKVLTAILDQYQRFCTVIISRRRARIFSVYLGEIEEHTQVFEDDVPAKVNAGDWASLRQTKIANHIEDHVQRHVKNIAAKTLAFFRMHDFDRLIIGGHKEVITQFIEAIHPELRERIVGQFTAGPDLPLKTVLGQSLKCEEEVEKREETDLINKINDAEKPGGVGVMGLESTVEALMLGQVHMLVLAGDLSVKGGICEEHHFISTYQDVCPICFKPLIPRDDIIEEMVQQAIGRNCLIKYINYHPEFAKEGQAGALLRFAV